MNRKLLLTLPMVALLSSCGLFGGKKNNDAPKNDAFSKIIKQMNISQATKDEVSQEYDEFEFIASKYEDMKMYRKLDDGSWSDEPLGISFESTDYYKTTCVLHPENANCAFYKVYNYGTEYQSDSQEFKVDLDENGEFEFVGTKSSKAPRLPKDAYYNAYNSVFAWKTSLFCGSTEFQNSTGMTRIYFEQKVLNVLTKNFEFSQGEPGSFTISAPHPASYSCKDFQITLHSFSVRYEDYLLAQYKLDFTLEYVAGNKTVDHNTINVYNVDYIHK